MTILLLHKLHFSVEVCMVVTGKSRVIFLRNNLLTTSRVMLIEGYKPVVGISHIDWTVVNSSNVVIFNQHICPCCQHVTSFYSHMWWPCVMTGHCTRVSTWPVEQHALLSMVSHHMVAVIAELCSYYHPDDFQSSQCTRIFLKIQP